MVAPFDYTINAQNPVDAMFSGIQFGDQRRQAAQQLAMGEQSMGIANSQEARAQAAFDAAQQDRAAALAEAENERAQTEAMNADLAALSAKVAGGTYGADDFAAIATKYPEFADELSKSWEGVAKERRDADVANLVRGVTAIKAGRPDLAVQMLEDRATAAENAGDKMEADISRALAASIKADPNAAIAVLGTLLQVNDPEAAKNLFGSAPEMTASQKDYKFYADQETAAGRKPLSFNDWDLQGKKAGASSTVVNTGSVSADGTPKVGVSLAEIQTSVQSATDLIDQIANDPALPKVTGSLEGGGGNSVDEFGTARAAYYGDDGLAVIQKIAQLQNTAWLAARDMLKGGGAITDYESKKAEGAMARLSRRQGDAEYKAALKDLRDAITDGAEKLKAAGQITNPAGNSGSQAGAGQAAPSFEDALSKYGVAP